MRIAELQTRLRALGAKPLHEQRFLRRWAQAQPMDAGKQRGDDFWPATT